MDSYQIIAGFSEIKSELRTKAKVEKPLTEIQLWFSFEDNVLYVHDYDDHEKNIVLAIYDSSSSRWRILLGTNRPGHRLLAGVVKKEPVRKIHLKLRNLNKLYGFYTFSRS